MPPGVKILLSTAGHLASQAGVTGMRNNIRLVNSLCRFIATKKSDELGMAEGRAVSKVLDLPKVG